MSAIKCPNASEEAKELYRALHKHDIYPVLEYWDGHKHVDLCAREARLFIEIDGPQHKYNFDQMMTDLGRDYCSRKQKYKTLRFTNQEVRDKLGEVANKIIKEIKNGKN